ncbi:MAG: class I SAM-dependent RNA methyltransferase [Rhodospirillaceae bacterium]|nr:class I SAM-dependent RNA methyltransferase [Rhodospirillaceae bacterium]
MSGNFLIHDLGPKGDGIHRSDQGPIYIDRALPGDTVKAQVQRGSGGVLRGELLEIVAPSPHRVPAPCPHFETCGGCTLQHADVAFYREWKTGWVRAALRKANVEPERWEAPAFLPEGTRRRVTFAAYQNGKTVTLGYFRRRTHQVTEITTCLVAEPMIMELRNRLGPLLAPLLQPGKTTDAFIQSVGSLCEVVITGPIGEKGTPDLRVFEAAAHMAHTLKLARVSWRGRERDEPEVLLEVAPLYAAFGPLNVALPPLAFLQPTALGEQALVSAVMDALPKQGKFTDLFSGCGTFSGPMLRRGAVDAFEGEVSAVGALDKAKDPQKLKAQQRDLFRKPLQPDELNRYDAIVFDPPRAGAEEQAKALAACKVPRLVAVSCNPTTFARDARLLMDGGYRLESVKVIDQFTWSHHVELVAAFGR